MSISKTNSFKTSKISNSKELARPTLQNSRLLAFALSEYVSIDNNRKIHSPPQAVQMTTKRNLCKLKGLSEMKVDKIREAASKILVILACP